MSRIPANSPYAPPHVRTVDEDGHPISIETPRLSRGLTVMQSPVSGNYTNPLATMQGIIGGQNRRRFTNDVIQRTADANRALYLSPDRQKTAAIDNQRREMNLVTNRGRSKFMKDRDNRIRAQIQEKNAGKDERRKLQEVERDLNQLESDLREDRRMMDDLQEQDARRKERDAIETGPLAPEDYPFDPPTNAIPAGMEPRPMPMEDEQDLAISPIESIDPVAKARAEYEQALADKEQFEIDQAYARQAQIDAGVYERRNARLAQEEEARRRYEEPTYFESLYDRFTGANAPVLGRDVQGGAPGMFGVDAFNNAAYYPAKYVGNPILNMFGLGVENSELDSYVSNRNEQGGMYSVPINPAAGGLQMAAQAPRATYRGVSTTPIRPNAPRLNPAPQARPAPTRALPFPTQAPRPVVHPPSYTIRGADGSLKTITTESLMPAQIDKLRLRSIMDGLFDG